MTGSPEGKTGAFDRTRSRSGGGEVRVIPVSFHLISRVRETQQGAGSWEKRKPSVTIHADRDEAGRFRGCLLGLACGDAVGTTVEFTARGRFTPVTDMVGGGVFGLPPGA
jgi:hypothetical protein